MPRIPSLLCLLLPFVLPAGVAAAQTRTRAGLTVERWSRGQERTSEFSRDRRFLGRVTVHGDGRIVAERAVHDAGTTCYRITNFVATAAGARPGGLVRILEWARPGDRGGFGTIRTFADGRREVEGTPPGPIR